MQTQSLPGCKTSSTPPPPHRDNFLSSLPLPIYLASKKKPITVHRQCCVTADQWRLWPAGIGSSGLSKWFPIKLCVKANICQIIIQIVLFWSVYSQANLSVTKSPVLPAVPPTALAPDWLFVDQEKVDNSLQSAVREGCRSGHRLAVFMLWTVCFFPFKCQPGSVKASNPKAATSPITYHANMSGVYVCVGWGCTLYCVLTI